MQTTPLVSVIIPSFNRAKELPGAIESVLRQSYPRIEIVVVDDGSTDDTDAVAARYGNAIRFVKQPNGGPSSARNRGVAESSGEILMFLDSDDEWLPEKVRRQVETMSASPALGCCWCNTVMRFRDGTEQNAFDIALLDPQAPAGHWTNVFDVVITRFILLNQGLAVRRETMLKVGGYDESLRLMEDHDLAMRLAKSTQWSYLAEPLAIWHERRSK